MHLKHLKLGQTSVYAAIAPVVTQSPKYKAFKKIVTERQFGKVDGVAVDLFSASAVVQILENLNPANAEKYLALPIQKMVSIAFKMAKASVEAPELDAAVSDKAMKAFKEMQQRLNSPSPSKPADENKIVKDLHLNDREAAEFLDLVEQVSVDASTKIGVGTGTKVVKKSKVNPNVTYHSSSVGSFRYLKVYFFDKLMLDYSHGPVQGIAALMNWCEKFMKECPLNKIKNPKDVGEELNPGLATAFQAWQKKLERAAISKREGSKLVIKPFDGTYTEAPRDKTDLQGTVKWYNEGKGYGFIDCDEFPSQPIFLHYSAIVGEGFKTVNEGQSVIFDAIDGPKGPQASNVRKT